MAGERSSSALADRLSRLWAAVPDHAPLALAVVGLFLYGVVWTAYSIFYRSFGITPREAGVEYGEIVQEAAVAVVVYAVIALVVIGGLYVVLHTLPFRVPRWYRPFVIWLVAVVVVLYPCADAYFSGRHAKQGDGVVVGQGWFPLPLGLPFTAPRVSLRFFEAGAARASGISRDDCVVYLGSTNETTVLWVLDENKANGRVVQVPKRVTVVDGQTSSCDNA